MRAVIQRVSRAEITIDHRETRSIGPGLVVFLGVMQGDGEAQADFLAEKVHGLRVFTDENQKMNLSLEDVQGELLVVSNFTLGTDCKKGRRPSFDLAAPPQEADRLYQRFVAHAKEQGIRKVETGEFGAHMDVLCANDGPVTLIIDTEKIGK
ncbi:MAG TPA: D-tyrosyl-tRNA(Tyr) deacylase [Candidatus Acutalibacter pullicola]|uniref:D-aminoacyl-tRNA deacylase n=1 Tax=Candidatus Acutalibacter pullicola TaxID=2838417 RepID=A0A9D2SFL9_9FIRM|nr:D-tyrosyl-tRNA(Tyr) deacylase [Candidatus Acutalibacter pullicola]